MRWANLQCFFAKATASQACDFTWLSALFDLDPFFYDAEDSDPVVYANQAIAAGIWLTDLRANAWVFEACKQCEDHSTLPTLSTIPVRTWSMAYWNF